MPTYWKIPRNTHHTTIPIYPRDQRHREQRETRQRQREGRTRQRDPPRWRGRMTSTYTEAGSKVGRAIGKRELDRDKVRGRGRGRVRRDSMGGTCINIPRGGGHATPGGKCGIAWIFPGTCAPGVAVILQRLPASQLRVATRWGSHGRLCLSAWLATDFLAIV